MYRVIGSQKLIAYFALLVGAIFLALWFRQRPADLPAIWRTFSTAAAMAGAGAFLVGQTPAFPLLCRHTPLRHLFPDIDGKWYATLDSNWPQIAALAELPATTSPVAGEIRIKARLFSVKLRYTSISPDPEYIRSHTLSVSVTKDADDGELRIFYIYEAIVKIPKSTDSGHHYGAAFLDLVGDNPIKARLSGAYWTNRNWKQGHNTAGVIELQRVT